MSEGVKVKDYMTRNVITVSPKDTIKEVALKMLETNHDGFPVVDEEGKVIGYVSSRDLLLKDPEIKIEEVMTPDPFVARPSMDLSLMLVE